MLTVESFEAVSEKLGAFPSSCDGAGVDCAIGGFIKVAGVAGTACITVD